MTGEEVLHRHAAVQRSILWQKHLTRLQSQLPGVGLRSWRCYRQDKSYAVGIMQLRAAMSLSRGHSLLNSDYVQLLQLCSSCLLFVACAKLSNACHIRQNTASAMTWSRSLT